MTMEPKIERRCFAVQELRAESDGDKRMIVGHAAVFDSLSEELWGFREKIAKGAFSESIKRDDVRALFNHSPNFVLGRNRANTLRMKEDDEGLLVEIDPPDTQIARDVMASIERGDITGMSIGFITQEEKWERGKDKEPDIRTLMKVQLFDVSPVTFPAYPETDVDVAKRSHEYWLRDTGEPMTVYRGYPLSLAKARLALG